MNSQSVEHLNLQKITWQSLGPILPLKKAKSYLFVT